MGAKRQLIRESFSEERKKIKAVFDKLSAEEQSLLRREFNQKFGKNKLYGLFRKDSPYALLESHLRFFAEKMFKGSLSDIVEADFVISEMQVKVVKTKKVQPKITQHSQASLFILANPDHEKRSKRVKTTVSAEVQRSEEIS